MGSAGAKDPKVDPCAFVKTLNEFAGGAEEYSFDAVSEASEAKLTEESLKFAHRVTFF